MSKPRQIKPWPDLTGLLPLLRAEEALTKARAARIHLDMSNVNKVDAIGLSIFIAQVCQILAGKEFQPVLTEPKNKRIARELEELGFQNLLAELNILSSEHQDLFSPNLTIDGAKTKKIRGSFNKIICVSPISAVNRSNEIARIKSEIKEFLSNDKNESFPHQQVMIILVELVKNTLDHSGNAALLALKLESSREGISQFSFAYSDTGLGICHSVRRHMAKLVTSEIPNGDISDARGQISEIRRLAAKGSFADLLQWALKPGNSTKHGNGINLGLGLMLIVEASRNCNVRVTVKDADTSMVLTELLSPTHSLIRRLGVKTCAAPMLIFYGEIDLEKNYEG